jgi:hypothetical protein
MSQHDEITRLRDIIEFLSDHNVAAECMALLRAQARIIECQEAEIERLKATAGTLQSPAVAPATDEQSDLG